MKSYLKLHKTPISFILLSSLFYVSFGYDLLREDSTKLLCLVAACFFFTYKLLSWERNNFKLLVSAGLLFRLVLLGSIPALSQDFYRYIWDGELFISGINPYLHTPKELINTVGQTLPNASLLYEKMGELSQKHYSNYPPVSQYIYALAAYIGQGSIAVCVGVFKIIILLADTAILFFSLRLMQLLGLPQWKAFWYYLNPLVIIELSGNLHLEGLMIAFFLAGIYLLVKIKKEHNWKYPLVSLALALSIMTKLIPILFYPFLLLPLGFKKWLQTGIYILLLSTLLLWPLIGQGVLTYYLKTIGLWFNNFEFNASIYNLIKSISKGVGNSGYSTILTYGKFLPFLILGSALLLLFWQYKKSLKPFYASMPEDSNNLPSWRHNSAKINSALLGALWTMLLLYTAYLSIATTVHPWYLIFGLILSLFTPYNYFIVWSFAVFLSYITYASPTFKENLWVLALEYLCVFGFFAYEIVRIKASEYISVKNV